MSSRAMYSCDLGGGIMPSAEASDSASDTFERSDAADEPPKLRCRFDERRDFLPLGGLLPSSGSKLASCFDCHGGLLISRVFIVSDASSVTQAEFTTAQAAQSGRRLQKV